MKTIYNLKSGRLLAKIIAPFLPNSLFSTVRSFRIKGNEDNNYSKIDNFKLLLHNFIYLTSLHLSDFNKFCNSGRY